MKQAISCPVCGSESLTAATHSHEFIHSGERVAVLGLEHYECATCGADPIFAEQIRRNERKIADAKRRAQGLLTATEVLGVREGLGLSQAEAAQLFGGGANAFSKYERGEVIQSVPMDRLLRVAKAIPFVTTLLRMLCGSSTEHSVAIPSSFVIGREVNPAAITILGIGDTGSQMHAAFHAQSAHQSYSTKSELMQYVAGSFVNAEAFKAMDARAQGGSVLEMRALNAIPA